MSRRLLMLIICLVTLVPMLPAAETVGSARVQDRPMLTTQKIRPGDASERDPAFARVRQAMLSAARRNDLDAVVRHFAPQVGCYGETMPAAACAVQLRTNPDLNFLASLEHALEIGTAFDQATIVAPYVAVSADIIIGLPKISGRYFVVGADRVRARSAPSSRAAIVEVLSRDIVATESAEPDATQVTQGDTCESWAHIVTPSKREAWICWKYLASPLEDTTFIFQRQPDGEWKLTDVYVPD